MAVGVVSGTVVPIFGTVVGGAIGLVAGLVVSVVVVPLILRRDLSRAFGVMLGWSLVFAGICLPTTWIFAFAGYDAYLTEIYTFVVVPVTVLLYLAGAWWSRSRHPVAWPKLPGNACRRCGYSLAGLAGWICPECGHDNERKRLAQSG